MDRIASKCPARARILCVDDEPHILQSLRDALYRDFDVRVAASGPAALAALDEEPDDYAVIISDMRMPVMPGSVFLREARRVAPCAARVLLTGYADVDAAVSAVNDAQLFRFLTKPCPRRDLVAVCEAGVAQHRLQTAERDLLEKTLHGAVDALAGVLALASPAALGRSGHIRDLAANLARAVEVEEPWEVEVAALLVNLGAVTLPAATAEKVYEGADLTPVEQAMVDRVPELTSSVLAHIPRLDGVLEILAHYRRPYAVVDAGDSLSIGSRILRIALDFDALEAHRADRAVAIATMRGRGIAYDPQLLAIFADLVGTEPSQDRMLEMPLRELRPGMLLADDVRSRAGALLIARGHRASRQLITRLGNLGATVIREPLLVLDEDIEDDPII